MGSERGSMADEMKGQIFTVLGIYEVRNFLLLTGVHFPVL